MCQTLAELGARRLVIPLVEDAPRCDGLTPAAREGTDAQLSVGEDLRQFLYEAALRTAALLSTGHLEAVTRTQRLRGLGSESPELGISTFIAAEPSEVLRVGRADRHHLDLFKPEIRHLE